LVIELSEESDHLPASFDGCRIFVAESPAIERLFAQFPTLRSWRPDDDDGGGMRTSTGFGRRVAYGVAVCGATVTLGARTAHALGIIVADATYNGGRGVVLVEPHGEGELFGSTTFDPAMGELFCNPFADGYLRQEHPELAYVSGTSPSYTGGNLLNVSRSFGFSDLTQQYSWIFTDSFQVDCGRDIHVTTEGRVGPGEKCPGDEGIWLHGTGSGHDLDENVLGRVDVNCPPRVK
jgi:hypothetical protein